MMNIHMNTFEQGPIRPPAEADSLLIRTTRGCPWNRCHFCTLFKGHRFSLRSVEEIKNDIASARRHYNGAPFETCFLQDGDSFAMRTNDLIEVLTTLKDAFPSLRKISSYGRAQTMMSKSEAEIKEIHDAGLNMLYCGIESGSDQVLEAVNKGVTQDALIQSALKARQAGMSLMVFVILGLGGKELSEHHARETAQVLNTINPNSVRIMSLAVKQETALWKKIENGSFTLLSETEMIEEQRQLIEQLKDIHSHYGNFHGINLLTELDAVLPEEKTHLLAIIDDFLALNTPLQLNFILGKRLGYYSHLAGFQESSAFHAVQQQIRMIQRENSESIEAIFHNLRNRII
jgi:radical SAM superfamily enzyme YgiQ (UPF0313 family)